MKNSNRMNRIISTIKNNPRQSLFWLVMAYPILPLVLMASYYLFIFGLLKLLYTDSFSQTIIGILVAILFLGGPAGLLGGILIAFKKYTRSSIALCIYGSISYFIIAGIFLSITIDRWFVYGYRFNALTLFYLFTAIFTAIIIVLQLWAVIKHQKNRV